MKIKIVFENKNFLVINKPAGILVHPTLKKEKDTLVDWILTRLGSPALAMPKALRAGIVHRLDKDTSGLLIIAKNNKYFNYLKDLFKNRKITKKYIALVHGILKDKKGIITKVISKRKTFLDKNFKKAWTEYKVIKEYKNYSLLEVNIKTGRTHQIRIHLSSIGHPVAGDKQYKFKRQICPNNLSRQFLHAKHLKFQLINGKIVKFKSNLPKDLKNVLKNLD